ncbi:hypothetical protein [Thaumasiovibrio sp. DFM-14]|uniref:hypothetical protein n=1 Tax=Thaumasiovibrio sp. DFM-14 TaxID=3384792 RepID=UPI0039A2AC16
MNSLTSLDINYLENLCCELDACLKDESVKVPVKDKEHLINQILAFKQLVSELMEGNTEAHSLSQRCDEIIENTTLVINIEKHHPISELLHSLQRTTQTICHYVTSAVVRCTNKDTSHAEEQNLNLALKDAGLHVSQDQRHKGNMASILSAYTSGYLDVQEVVDAIRAIITCQQDLSLSHMDTYKYSA